MDIPCIITERRQIKDYFPLDAVKAVLPKNVQDSWSHDPDLPMGKQFGKGWKKYNRKIAASMKWDDIEGHRDILSLFDTIERIAKELRPG